MAKWLRRSIIIVLCCISVNSYGVQYLNAPFIDFGPTIKKLMSGLFGIGVGYEITLGNYMSAELTLGYDYRQDNVLFQEGVHEYVPGIGVRVYFSGTAPVMAWAGIFGQYYAAQILGEWGGFAAVSLRIGYKIMLADNLGFFVDPYIGFSGVFQENILFGSDFGLRVGWAF